MQQSFDNVIAINALQDLLVGIAAIGVEHSCSNSLQYWYR